MSGVHMHILQAEWNEMTPRQRKRFFRRYRLIAVCIKRLLEDA